MGNNCSYKGCVRGCIGEFCMQHKPRKAISKRSAKKKEEPKKNTFERDQFFLSIWNKRSHVSEISGEPLGQISSIYFHHILEKEIYPELEFDKANIILVNWIEHDNLHKNMFKYEKVNNIREKLIKKYEEEFG